MALWIFNWIRDKDWKRESFTAACWFVLGFKELAPLQNSREKGRRNHLGVDGKTYREERSRMNVPSNVKRRIFCLYFCLCSLQCALLCLFFGFFGGGCFVSGFLFLGFLVSWDATGSGSHVCRQEKV